MLDRIKQKAALMKYRINLRKALLKANSDELHICLEETRKEIERRNKKK